MMLRRAALALLATWLCATAQAQPIAGIANVVGETDADRFSAIRLRVNEPDMERPFKVGLKTPAFIAMCAVPITVAVFAMSPWGNGWNYFIWGTVAALTGPPAYFIFKRIYGGQRALDAERAAGGEEPPAAD